jgi:tetratricopeptide (TPR) repeat protein
VLIARGRSFLGQNQPARAIDDFARAIAKGPRRRAAWSGRGEAFAVQGRWKESEQDFRRAIDLDPLSFDDQESRLVVLLAAGRLDEYRKALAKMIEEFGREERSNYSLPLARACVRIPKAVNVTTMLGLALKSEKEQPAEPAHRCCVGAALYRAGLYESALTRLLASRKAGKPRAATEFFLAMTYAALGRKADAAAALQRGVTITEEEERKKVLSWRQRLVRQALRQEAATAAR